MTALILEHLQNLLHDLAFYGEKSLFIGDGLQQSDSAQHSARRNEINSFSNLN
jgi:hypothetical protein